MLGMINRSITYKCTTISLQLYKSLVRPHLEFCTAAWSPHYEDRKLLEWVQRRFTRMIPGLRELPYESRLQIKTEFMVLRQSKNTCWPIEDLAQFFGRKYPRRNHVFQIWWRSVQGFSVGWGSNFAIPHWLWRSSLQHSHYRVSVWWKFPTNTAISDLLQQLAAPHSTPAVRLWILHGSPPIC